MHDVNHAIDLIGDLTGLTDLSLDDNGQAALTFNGTVQVDLSRIDGQNFEFVAELPSYADSNAAAPRRLLEANYLGAATGAARLALSPSTGKLVLCQRVEVAGLDSRTLEARLVAFLKHVAFWTDGAGAALVQKAEEPAAELQADHFIRV